MSSLKSADRDVETKKARMGEPDRSPAERRADGKALRDKVPREDHAGWKVRKDRRNPIEILLESNQGRMEQLVPIRHGWMLQSSFAFYRGSAALIAEVRAYRERMHEYAFMKTLEVWYDKIDIQRFFAEIPKKLREKVQARIEKRVAEARGRTPGPAMWQ
jgi:Uncharacterized protein conserved in bacteria (DUF2252)